jgi:HEAT repeat protein
MPDARLGELIRTLALAWKNLAAYPAGHPALAGSVEGAHRRLRELGGPAGDVAFGIASDGLVYDGEKIVWPHAQKLAHALYTRGVAIVRFGAETTSFELETFLRALGRSPGDGKAIWEELTASGVANINLQPVDYSAVQVTDDLQIQQQQTGSLWEEILKALLAGKDISADASQLLSSVRSVDALAMLILRHVNDAGRSDAEFDPDATFGVRLQHRVPLDSAEKATARVAEAVGTHIASSSGLRRQLAVQQVVQLLRNLPDPLRQSIIQSVLRSLATEEGGAALLREFITPLDQDEVLIALRYLSTMVNLSSHAMRLLEALSAGGAPSRDLPPAPPALVAELSALFGDDDIDRFNPPEHQSLLESTIRVPSRPGAVGNIAVLGDRVDTVSDEAVHRSLARSLMEMIARHGTARDPEPLLRRVEAVVTAQVASGQFADALEIVQTLREISADASLARLAGRETMNSLVAGLLTAPPEVSPAIHSLIDALGSVALQSLLVALAEEENRSRRRKLFDFVSGLGHKIVPDVVRFLSDPRWYVVRNMILLLRGVNDRSSLPEIRRLAEHPDLRVRLEAIKALLALDPSVPPSLLENAINDPDPKMAETAIALAGSYGIREAVGPLSRILEGRDLFGSRRQLRLRAIKALGDLGAPEALPAIEPFLTSSIFPWPAREERRAAWESLAAYPPEARAPFVDRGLTSRDEVVRDLCRRMGRER